MGLRAKLEQTKKIVETKREEERAEPLRRTIEELNQQEQELRVKMARVAGLFKLLVEDYRQANEKLGNFRNKKKQIDDLYGQYKETLAAEGIKDKSEMLAREEYGQESEALEYRQAGGQGRLGESVATLAEIKKALKEELPELDLKFSGGIKNNPTSNRTAALEKINEYLVRSEEQLQSLAHNRQALYETTPEGRAEKLVKDKRACGRELNISHRQPINDLNRMSKNFEVHSNDLKLVDKYGTEIVEQVLFENYVRQTDGLLINRFKLNDREKIISFWQAKPFFDNLEAVQKSDQEVRAEYNNYLNLKDAVIRRLASLFADEEKRSRASQYGISSRAFKANLQNDIERNTPPNEKDQVALGVNYLKALDTSLSLSGLKSKILSGSIAHYSQGGEGARFERFFQARRSKDSMAETYWGGRDYVVDDIAFDNNYNPAVVRGELINYQKFLQKVLDELNSDRLSAPTDLLNSLSEKKWPGIKAVEAELISNNKEAERKFPDKYLDPYSLEPTAKYREDSAVASDFFKRKAVVDKHLKELISIRLLEFGIYKQQNEHQDLLRDYRDLENFGEFSKALEAVCGNLAEADLSRQIKVYDSRGYGWQIDDLAFNEQYRKYSDESREAGLADKYQDHIKRMVSDILAERHRINNGYFISKKDDKLKKLDNRLQAVQLLNNSDARFLLKISKEQLATLKDNLPAEQMAEIEKFREDYGKQEGGYQAQEKYSREFSQKINQVFKLFNLSYGNFLRKDWDGKITTPKDLLLDAKISLDKMRGAWASKDGVAFLKNLANSINLYQIKSREYAEYEKEFTPVKFDLSKI